MENFQKWSLIRFLIKNMQTYKLQRSALRVFKTRRITSTVEFLFQEQALMDSLQNHCSKQQLKLPRRPVSVLEKDFTVDVLLSKRLRKSKIKTSKRKNFILQCRSRCRVANAEISKWPIKTCICLVKIVDGGRRLAKFAKSFILHVWQEGSYRDLN